MSAVVSRSGSSGRLEAFVERRVSIGQGGRNAFGAGVAGGGEVALAGPMLKLRGYGQAGIVGVRSRDLYADGELAVERKVYRSTAVDVALGAGMWGGAQPGVSRGDVGPFVGVTLRPVGVRATAGWRQRFAGNAAPDSGPVLTIGTDF